MSFNLSNIKWGWVALGVVITFIIAFGGSICTVTGYSAYLAFKVMGPPDQALINEFAGRAAEGIQSVLIGVGALLGGLLAGRKAKVDALQNGLAVGLLSALISLVFGLTGGFTLWTLVSIVLSIGGGWAGGQLASKRA